MPSPPLAPAQKVFGQWELLPLGGDARPWAEGPGRYGLNAGGGLIGPAWVGTGHSASPPVAALGASRGMSPPRARPRSKNSGLVWVEETDRQTEGSSQVMCMSLWIQPCLKSFCPRLLTYQVEYVFCSASLGHN